MRLTIRPLRLPAERDFLDEVVYLACTWYEPTAAHPHPDRADLLRDMTVYLEVPGRPGDVAVGVDLDGRLIAGALYRLFPRDRHGHGWLDEHTPELGIAVVDGFRGTGVGRALLATLLTTAQLEGHPRISLHVSDGNGARRLYESLGFQPVRPSAGGWIMVRDFGSPVTT